MRNFKKIITTISAAIQRGVDAAAVVFSVILYYLGGGYFSSNFKKKFREDGSFFEIIFAYTILTNGMFLCIALFDLMDYSFGLNHIARSLGLDVDVREYTHHNIKITLRIFFLTLFIPLISIARFLIKEEERSKRQLKHKS